MKELLLQYVRENDDATPIVRVEYRQHERAQAQKREVPFDFTVSDEQRKLIQWYLEEYLTCPWGVYPDRAKEAEALMKSLGEGLFQAIFSDPETFSLYANVKNDLPSTRIVIHADHPEGVALPWELLRDPSLHEYGDLARRAHAFVRSQPDLFFETPSPPAGETFNILLVISRPKANDVAFQSVARPLLELIRPHRDRIRLDVLRPPTFERLARVLAEKPNFYHLVHFDGHGGYPQDGAGEGILVFEGEGDEPRLVTGQELGDVLAGKGVPVVVLNACQSGMTHPEAIYASVGNSLLRAGASGVVAMAYSVYVSSAVRFVARLYEGLINGEELSRAVALGRDALKAHPQRQSPIGEIALQDWVVPVLFEAAPVQAMAQPLKGLRLDPRMLKDEQETAGAEIECPPPPEFGFIGRDGAILELERAFQTETAVLLKGMAGIGKTEAAVGFARWRAETGALDGPIFFFSFEKYLTLAGVCDRVGQVFGPVIKQQLGAEWHLLNAEQRREMALSILKQVPCLMIWDNFEPVVGFPTGSPSDWTAEEQAELSAFLRDLRGGQTKVLVTSRRDEPKLGNLRTVELGGLKLHEAQELAVAVLKRAGQKPNEIRKLPDYTALLKYLGGNPLAIQVILPELARMTPDALLQAVQAGEVKLNADDAEQGRQKSLSASLTYRLNALDPLLHKRLGLLGLFQGFVDADVLAAICAQESAPEFIRGLRREDWISILTPAAEVGLLRELGEGCYTVHPALPWFFHDLMVEGFPDLAWLERVFVAAYGAYGYYLNQLFQRNAQLSISLLQAEESNLLHSLYLGRKHEQWGETAGTLYGLSQLLTHQGRWVEWERLIRDIDTDVTGPDGQALSGREYLWIATLGHLQEIASYQRDFKTQKTILEQLSGYYQTIQDDNNHSVALHQLGIVAQQQRQFEEAKQWYRQSLEIKERIGAEYGQSLTLHQLGMVAQQQRQFEEAKQWYRQSLEIEERIGNEHGQAGTLHNIGAIAQGQHQFEEAKRWYRQSLEIEERIGNEHGQAETLHQLGIVAQQQRQFEEAEQWYRQSLEINERIGAEYGQSLTLHQLGRIMEESGNSEEALKWCRAAEAMLLRLNDPHNLEIVRTTILRIQESNQQTHPRSRFSVFRRRKSPKEG